MLESKRAECWGRDQYWFSGDQTKCRWPQKTLAVIDFLFLLWSFASQNPRPLTVCNFESVAISDSLLPSHPNSSPQANEQAL